MQRGFRQKSFTLPYSFQHNVFFLFFFVELPYFPTSWQQMHSKLPRRLLNEAHASELCTPPHPPSQAVCAPDVDVVGVLDQDEAFGGNSSTSWRTSTALNHPSLISLPSLLMGIFFSRVKHIFNLRERENDCDVKQNRKTTAAKCKVCQDRQAGAPIVQSPPPTPVLV